MQYTEQIEQLSLKSSEEILFAHLILDLKNKGYIKETDYEAKSIVLSEKVTYEYQIKLKTKVKTKEKVLLSGHVYTPDWIIKWHPNAWNVFVSDDNTKPFYGVKDNDDITSIIEVKGSFNNHNMVRLFRLNQKWAYDKHGIFIQLVVMPKFLSKIYIPEGVDLNYKRGPKKGRSKVDSRSFDDFIALK